MFGYAEGAARGRRAARRRLASRRRSPWPPAWSRRAALVAQKRRRDGDARPLGGARRRDGGGRARRRCRWSSACTDRTSSSPSGTPSPARSPRRPFDRAGCRHRLQRRSRDARDRRSAPTRRMDGRSPTASTPRASGRAGDARDPRRARLGIPADAPLVFTAGRLVKKKGFEYPDRRHAGARGATAAAAAGACRRRRPRGGAARARLSARGVRGSRAFLGVLTTGRRRRMASPRPTSPSCLPSATTPATSTACRTSCWRRWPRAPRSSPRRPAASPVLSARPERAAGAGARRRRPRGGDRSAARRPGAARRAGTAARADACDGAMAAGDGVGRAFEAAYDARPAYQLARPERRLEIDVSHDRPTGDPATAGSVSSSRPTTTAAPSPAW